jgi:hypothetical protein
MNVLYAELAISPRRIFVRSYQYRSKTKAKKGERI